MSKTATAVQPVTDANLWSEYAIEAHSSLTDQPLRSLKHGDAFAVVNGFGDIEPLQDSAQGLFYCDTRFLSQFEMRLEGKKPLLLGSAMHDNKSALTVELTNPDVLLGKDDKLPKDTIFLTRTTILRDGASYERIGIRNFGSAKRRLRLDFLYAADFHDLFEIRGTKRHRRGTSSSDVIDSKAVRFKYRGLDKIERTTLIQFDPQPFRLEPGRATIEVEIAPRRQTSIFITVLCLESNAQEATQVADYFRAYRDTRRERRRLTRRIATVATSNEAFEEVVSRATSDVYTLVTAAPHGLYPYAGIPWFNTVFGRDGIITAMLMLWIDPALAQGVLLTLAATQATEEDAASDAQPGKILHEMRHGEMANLGEVPFRRYYGTVDATPLYVMLAGMYLDRTGDSETIRDIWPNIEAALRWIDSFGDADGDGFIEYERARASGLANQGWKDSYDAIFHADGTIPAGPIALCEVQGYVFAAKRYAARMARILGRADDAARLSAEAERLRVAFEVSFWCERMETYVLALDGDKRPCRVRASNAGHALFTGIAATERARKVAASLLNAEGFSGWGIRTLSLDQPRYNPMSYHNGSVWPHDNALIAMGFARYGMKNEVCRVLSAIFSAARYQDMRRLPELFCGFKRRIHLGPTPYPVACAPQAWAAASVFGLLQACLGLQFLYSTQEIVLQEPLIPDFLEELTIGNLRLGNSRVDLHLHRYANDVTVSITGRVGDAKVILVK